jgi:hypothetical protein
VVILAIVGSSNVEVKLFGPVQEYVALATVAEVRLNVVPAQIGELLETGVGADGVSLIVTEVVPAVLPHPATVAVTE